MPSYTLLISLDDFAGRADLSANIDEKYVNTHILKAQEQFLKPTLGAAFYDSLIAQKASGYWDDDITEQLYTDYILPFLVYQSYALYLPYASAFMTGYGPVVMTEDNSEKLTDKAIAVMTEQARNSADHWHKEMIVFLCENISAFVLYENATDKSAARSGAKITRIGVPSRKSQTLTGRSVYYNRWKND